MSEKNNIRSITYSVDIDKILNKDYLDEIKHNLKSIKEAYENENYFVRTLRFNIVTQKFKKVPDQFIFIKKILNISDICNQLDIRWFNISFDLSNQAEKNIKSICNLGYLVLKKFNNSFINFIVANNNTINAKAILYCSNTILKVSKLSHNGFDNFRMGLSLNPAKNTPFFPFSYSLDDNKFSIATEISSIIEKKLEKIQNLSFDDKRKNIINSIGREVSRIDKIGNKLCSNLKADYVGQDISLAPYPDEDISVINIVKLFGIDNIGSNGSLFITSFLTDLLKEIILRYKIKSCGFNGIMYSMLEDKKLCDANNKKLLTLDSLIMYSSLCGCGVDMVPVPGSILEEEISSIVLDVAALSIKLNKPLGVRLLPIPNSDANEFTEFDMDFLTNTRIMNIKNIGCDNRVFKESNFKYYLNQNLGNLNDIDKMQDNIKNFWNKRAEKYIKEQTLSATNLEEDVKLQKMKVDLEQDKILSSIKLTKKDICLDLGCGFGAWSEILSPFVKKIIGVDYISKMIEIAEKNMKLRKIKNIDYFCSDAISFKTQEKFDFIFISGLLLYLSNKDIKKLVSQIPKYSKKDTRLVLREPTGIKGQYTIIDKFSKSLNESYSAIYRTRQDLISIFEEMGFSLDMDDDMFIDGSPLNKWEETKLRLYLFTKK